jgi:hypothetical protein
MTKEEATKILAVPTAAYPHAYKNISIDEADGIVTVWAIQFAKIPADIVFMAVNKCIGSCKFPPSISEVKDKVSGLHWDAYTAISGIRAEMMNEGVYSEYKRIYDVTKDYKFSKSEPELSEMLINNSKQFLIE